MEEELPKLKDFKTRDEGKVGAKVLVRSRLKIFGQGFIFVLRALLFRAFLKNFFNHKFLLSFD